MDWLSQWWTWLGVTAIPGLFNSVVAFRELNEKCRVLPFFEPSRSLGVWLWAVIQFSFPALLFWVVESISDRPEIDLELLAKAVIVYGLGFVALLNAEVTIGSSTYRIKPLYDAIVRIAYKMIENRQKRRSAAFWTDVVDVLRQQSDFARGLDFLENYFEVGDRITPDLHSNYGARVRETRRIQDAEERAMALKTLIMEVDRRDLVWILLRFPGTEDLVKKYYPRQFRRSLP
ncbi:MAG: hypothetical protein VKK04_08325 [Synechococcales bacterium]|nr:hypothetical protein [Synechococcales bacterium]